MNFGIAQETLKDRQEEKYQEFYKFFTSAVSQKGKKDVYNYLMETSISKLHFSMPSVQRSAIFEGVLMCLTTAVRALKVCLFKPASAQHRTGENDLKTMVWTKKINENK